jgi:hypothetical protein
MPNTLRLTDEAARSRIVAMSGTMPTYQNTIETVA